MIAPPPDRVRYELLPFPRAEREAAAFARPLTLTVTCSPRLGLDATVDVACRLRALGHAVVPHMAARMVRDRRHLDVLVARMADGGIDDVFLVGGDAPEPLGPYDSALDLIGALRGHARAPRRIGVAGYPEGHPLIDPARLAEALRRKAARADYVVSQLCFDVAALRRWLEATRAAGVGTPVYLGVPGAVDRRRLLEVSLRVGVGPSVRFVRKQRGLRRLLGRPGGGLLDAVAPLLAGELGVAGLHAFTFNQLAASVGLVEQRLGAAAPRQAITRELRRT